MYISYTSYRFIFYLILPRHPLYTLFPYTTLFRSSADEVATQIASLIAHPVAELYTNPASSELARQYYADVEFRSEEHTSELQSRQYLVYRLLLEKKYIQRKHKEVCITYMIKHNY